MNLADSGLKISIIYDFDEDVIITECPFCRSAEFGKLCTQKRDSSGKGNELVEMDIYKCRSCSKFFGSGLTADGREFLWLQQTDNSDKD